MLERFGMSDCKPRSTPSEPREGGFKNEEEKNSEFVDPRGYREIVGSLIYAKHVLRYLKGTVDYELCFKKNEEDLKLIGFSDADWASSVEDRRSTTGYCFSLTKQGPVISWKTKKQPTVAEAEYIGLAATSQETIYLTQLLNGMDNRIHSCAEIHGDNQGAIALCKNPVNRQRSKHIDVKYHFIRNTLSEGKISIVYCPSEEMVADILTKPVAKPKIIKFKTWFFGN